MSKATLKPQIKKAVRAHSKWTRKLCDCARCRGVTTANPQWGYDELEVPAVCCMECLQPIGQESYLVDSGLARFGTMLFYHQRCAATEAAK